MEQINSIGISYLLLINLVTFATFAIDKFQAVRKKNVRRVSEFTLLLLSFLGGSLGGLFAISYFRHKISKNSFLAKFAFVVTLQIIVTTTYYTKIASMS